MKSVVIFIAEPDMQRFRIGSYPADYNETGEKGNGLVVWEAGTYSEGGIIPESEAYEITITSSTDGYNYADVSDTTFFLRRCEG